MKSLATALAAVLALAASAHAAPLLLDERALAARLEAQVAAQYDSARGGWLNKQGAAMDGAVDLALHLARAGVPGAWRARAQSTLDAIAAQQDTLGGGFTDPERYASPADASLGRRTDVNARRLELLTGAWTLTGEARDRQRAAHVVAFMDRVLLDGRGGFVTAQLGDRELVPAPNGLAIHAWLIWAATVNDTRVRDFALRSIDRVLATDADSAFGMVRRGTFGELDAPPQLLDQVEMGRACLLAAHLAGRAADLATARALADRMLRVYEDREKGGFPAQVMFDKKGHLRRAARVAGENARAALFLAELASVSGEDAYRQAARRTLAAFARELAAPTPESADWALAARAVLAAELPERPAWSDAKKPAPAKGAKPKGR